MNKFLSNTFEILLILADMVWQIVSGIFKWIVSVIARFCADVLKNMYSRVVAVTGLIILGLLISRVFVGQ